MNTRCSWWMASCVLLVTSATFGQELSQPAVTKPEAAPGLAEGWKLEYEVPLLPSGSKLPEGAIKASGPKVKLWVEKGWLVASRETNDGELEWEVVLAQATDSEPPRIEPGEISGFAITYGPGYFIRDNLSGQLRVFRQPKKLQFPERPKLTAIKSATSAGGWGMSQQVKIAGWQREDWWCAACGLPDDPDVWVRLEHKDLLDAGISYMPMTDMVMCRFGEKVVQDEGDLLIATRSTPEAAEQAIRAKKLRDEIKKRRAGMEGKTAPQLDVQQWFNVEGKPSLEELRGKVVLIDFWGTWCAPCVASLPKTEEIYQKFKDRGLVVIGVHSSHGADELEAFLKEKNVTFPVAQDTGESAKAYVIEFWPTYFLVDREGQLAWGFTSMPPDEQQIEKLLAPEEAKPMDSSEPAAQ